MDQVTEQRLHPPVDSREESLIDQRQGSQAPAPAPAPAQLLTSRHLRQTLATSLGDSDSQRNIGENSEEARRVKKRECDKKYRDKQKDKSKAVENDNRRLKLEKAKDKQRIKSLREKNARLKRELKQKERQYNCLLDRIARANEQSMSTNMQQFLAEFKQHISSLNQKVDGLQQNITQLSGTQVYTGSWHQQQSTLISQVSQAPATTLPPTLSSGTGSMQQIFQSPGTVAGDSPGLQDFSQQQQSGGQGGNSAIEWQPSAQGLSDQYQLSSEIFDFSDFHFDRFCYIKRGRSSMEMIKNRRTEKALGRNHARSTEQTTLEALEAENTTLEREGQQMKSNIEEYEAEHARLKRKIEEKEQQIKSCLEDFEADNGQLMREIEKKEQKMKNNREAFEAENGQLKHEMEEKERLMKSNMEGFEVKNWKLKLEIGEKEQPMKSNLESLEAEHGRLKREIEKEKLKMKSNLERLEAQIRQLADEFKSLNVDIVAVNLRMQTHQGN